MPSGNFTTMTRRRLATATSQFGSGKRESHDSASFYERFSPPTPVVGGNPFELVLARSGRRLAVAAGESALEALENAGIPVPSSCRSGICGTCVVKVTGGEPDHRDSVLTEDERTAGRFCTCVSRARGPDLIVDL